MSEQKPIIWGRVLKSLLMLSLVAIPLLASFGCATTEDDNLSARPWSNPQHWEHGLPSTMYEGR